MDQFAGGGEQNRKEKEKREKKEKEKERKGRGGEREGDRMLSLHFQRSTNQGVGIVHSSRGRYFLLLSLFLLKGHSMAIRFSPNNRASIKTVSTELLTV